MRNLSCIFPLRYRRECFRRCQSHSVDDARCRALSFAVNWRSTYLRCPDEHANNLSVEVTSGSRCESCCAGGLLEPPKPREEQMPGKSMEKHSSKRLQFLSLCVAANPCLALTKEDSCKRPVGLTKDIGLISHSLRNPLQGISHQLLGECCKPYLSRHVSVG